MDLLDCPNHRVEVFTIVIHIAHHPNVLNGLAPLLVQLACQLQQKQKGQRGKQERARKQNVCGTQIHMMEHTENNTSTSQYLFYNTPQLRNDTKWAITCIFAQNIGRHMKHTTRSFKHVDALDEYSRQNDRKEKRKHARICILTCALHKQRPVSILQHTTARLKTTENGQLCEFSLETCEGATLQKGTHASLTHNSRTQNMQHTPRSFKHAEGTVHLTDDQDRMNTEREKKAETNLYAYLRPDVRVRTGNEHTHTIRSGRKRHREHARCWSGHTSSHVVVGHIAFRWASH